MVVRRNTRWQRFPVLGGAVLLVGTLSTVTVWAQASAATGSASGTSSSVKTAGSGKFSPKALLAASLDAAHAQSSVHYVATSTVGNESIKVTADTATATASQVILLHVGKATGHVTGRLVDNAAYFRADTAGLEDYLGMPATLAPKYVGQWIKFTSSAKSYSDITKSMSLTSAVNQISVEPPLSGGHKTNAGGRSAVSVVGTTTSLSSQGNKGSAILYVSATGSPLPISYHGTGKQKKKSETGTITYSKWGETVRAKAPAKSVPASSLTG